MFFFISYSYKSEGNTKLKPYVDQNFNCKIDFLFQY